MPPIDRPLSLLGLLWGLPNTLLGLLFALLSPGRWTLREGMLVVESDRGLGHLLLTRRGFAWMTLGRVLLATRPLDRATWLHEREHARQAERLGPLFLPVYLFYHFRRGYAANPFERSARAVASALASAQEDETRPPR